MTRTVTIALTLLLTFACDGRDGTDAGPVGVDAGPRDASTPVDAGPLADSGPLDDDAGTPTDGGSTDAGAGTDAGPVDAGGATDAGPADAGVSDAGPLVGGDTCESAVDVTAGGTFRGTTLGATDTYSSRGIGCNFGNIGASYDVAYVVSPASTTSYRVSVTADSAADPHQVWVATDCDQSECPEGARDGVLTFTATGGVATFIVVEGQVFGDRSDFTLEVAIE